MQSYTCVHTVCVYISSFTCTFICLGGSALHEFQYRSEFFFIGNKALIFRIVDSNQRWLGTGHAVFFVDFCCSDFVIGRIYE